MRPKTYAEAVEELGGRPWQKLEGTEQWFLQKEESRKVPRELDTSDFVIGKRGLPVFAKMGLAWIGFALGGALLVFIVMGLVQAKPLPPLPPRVQPLAVAQPAPPAPPPPPAPIAPAIVPVAAPAPAPVKKPIVRRLKKHKNRYAHRE